MVNLNKPKTLQDDNISELNSELREDVKRPIFNYLVDATQLNCPMPLLKMKQVLNKAAVGETLLVKATDPASRADFESYIQMTNHQLQLQEINNEIHFWITKAE